MRRSVVLMVTLAAAGCLEAATDFVCAGPDACVLGVEISGQRFEEQGVCEPSGYCSFVDPTCPAPGRRYGTYAGAGLAGACVPGPADGGPGGRDAWGQDPAVEDAAVEDTLDHPPPADDGPEGSDATPGEDAPGAAEDASLADDGPDVAADGPAAGSCETRFSEGFSDLARWTQTVAAAWGTQARQSSTGYPADGSGDPVASGPQAADCSASCALTTTTAIDLSGLSGATLKLSRYLDSALPAAASLQVMLGTGTDWVTAGDFSGATDHDSTWHAERYDLAAYVGRTDFMIRLASRSPSPGGVAEVDDVRVTVHAEPCANPLPGEPGPGPHRGAGMGGDRRRAARWAAGLLAWAPPPAPDPAAAAPPAAARPAPAGRPLTAPRRCATSADRGRRGRSRRPAPPR